MEEELEYRWAPPKEEEYLWLSPLGEAIYCEHDTIMAVKILDERYGKHDAFMCPDPRAILICWGWMCYRHDEVLGRGWMIKENRKPFIKFFHMYGMIPKQAQKDKIVEIFGKEFDDNWVTWECVRI